MRQGGDLASLVPRQHAKVVVPKIRSLKCHFLGCSFPVKCRFVYAISANIFGKADGGGLARQRKQTDISQESYSPGCEFTRFKGSDFDIAEGTRARLVGERGETNHQFLQVTLRTFSQGENAPFHFPRLALVRISFISLRRPRLTRHCCRVRESGFFHDPKWNRYLWPLRHWPRPIKSNPLDF